MVYFILHSSDHADVCSSVHFSDKFGFDQSFDTKKIMVMINNTKAQLSWGAVWAGPQ